LPTKPVGKFVDNYVDKPHMPRQHWLCQRCLWNDQRGIYRFQHLATLLCTNALRLYVRNTMGEHDKGSFTPEQTLMKSTAIICAIAAASLGFSSLSFAQDHGRNDPRRDDQRSERHSDHRDGPRYEPRYDQRNERWNERRDYYNARGPEFSRGGHIPNEYRNRQYRVADYHTHHLSPPPRGHQWVQVGADYVLIAIATGVIAQIILNQ
jgi:Ni/Co efflux regulator RcnB